MIHKPQFVSQVGFYHGLAIPTWERKWRVFGNWAGHFFLGRDIVNIEAAVEPRAIFAEFAVRPKG